MKLLLSGDNPNRINRDLHYFGYVSQAQASLIEALRANLQAVERNQAETRNASDELEEIAQEQQQQKTRLETEKAHRATLLAQLAGSLAEQRKQAGGIARDEQRLGRLVDQLSRLIEEQQKAEAAAREKRRQEELARARARAAEEESSAQRRPRTLLPCRAHANPDAIDDDEPPARALVQNDITPEAGAHAGRAFAALRGHLRLPVAGEVTAKFGGRRSDGSGPAAKACSYAPARAAAVKAVADGRVVFADWLRGFGNLLIVDHGSQYLTIYGNNQALLKRPGDARRRRARPSPRTGNTGGNEESGLYFEMRHQGRAFDPLGWVTY